MNLIKKHLKPLSLLAIALPVTALNFIFGWTNLLSNPESLPFMQQALQENFVKAIIVYIVLTMAGCVILALPGVIFAVAAGIIFGPLWGTVACSVATTLGACFAFLVARYFMRDAVKPLVIKNKYIRRVFFEEHKKNDLFILMLTRLFPVFPYNLQNFAYGITDMRFGVYALYSFVFMLPGTAAYVIAAAGMRDSLNRFLYFGVAALLLGSVTAVALILKKRGLSVRDKPQKEND